MKLSISQLTSLITNGHLDRRQKNIIGSCPKCGGSEFGMSIEENHVFGCYRQKKCGFSGNIFTLLRFLGKYEEYVTENTVFSNSENKELENKIVDKEELKLELEDCLPPIGFKRVFENKYLVEERGWLKEDFQRYEVGTTILHPKLANKYIIFLIREAGKLKGYVSRHYYSKKRLEAIKEETGFAPPRYSNSDSDFAKLLYGYDEIEETTHTVILVEGVLDKTNVDRQLQLYELSDIKCLATFKSNLSPEQRLKLQRFKNLINLILFYDPDVIPKIRVLGTELENYWNVRIAMSKTENDPGAMNFEEMSDCLENTRTVSQFISERVNKKVLN